MMPWLCSPRSAVFLTVAFPMVWFLVKFQNAPCFITRVRWLFFEVPLRRCVYCEDAVSSLASRTSLFRLFCSALLCSVRQSHVTSVVVVRVKNIDAFLHHLKVGEEDHVHDARAED